MKVGKLDFDLGGHGGGANDEARSRQIDSWDRGLRGRGSDRDPWR
jgi:hypothetical protein